MLFSLHSFLCLLHHTFDRILIAFVIIFAFCFSRSNIATRVATEKSFHRRIYISLAFFASSQRSAQGPETESPKSEEKAIKSAFEMVRRSSYKLICRSNLITSENFKRFHFAENFRAPGHFFVSPFWARKYMHQWTIYRPPKSHRNHNLHKITRSFSFEMTFRVFLLPPIQSLRILIARKERECERAATILATSKHSLKSNRISTNLCIGWYSTNYKCAKLDANASHTLNEQQRV